MNKFSYFTLIIFFCENNFFQRGSGGGGGLCLTLWKFWRGEGPSVPLKYGKSREVEGGGGSLVKFPPWWSMGIFSNYTIIFMFFFSFLGYRKTLVSDSCIYHI